MVEAAQGPSSPETHAELLNYARELILNIANDISCTNEARVKNAYLGPESIEELKYMPTEPIM